MDINDNTFVCELSKVKQNYIRKKVTIKGEKPTPLGVGWIA